MPVDVGGRTFKTKTALENELKRISKIPSEVAQNQPFLLACVACYSKVQDAIADVDGCLTGVTCGPNPAKAQYGTGTNVYCLQAQIKGLGEPMCMSSDYIARSVVSRASADAVRARRPVATKIEELRDAVQPQIAEFKDSARGNSWACNGCQSPLNDLIPAFRHVDHTGSYEFRHLKNEYAHIHHNGDVTQIDTTAFATFHAQNARLQMLCIHCNVRKKRKAQDAYVSDNPLALARPTKPGASS
jgi:hypothetical protein